MSIKLVSTGGGSVTIQEPNTASDFTLSVPSRTGNVALDGPAFSATKSITQSYSGSTYTKITFPDELYDTAGCYDTSTSRFTPNVAGYYQVNLLMLHNYSGGTPSVAYVLIYKNGSVDVQHAIYQSAIWGRLTLSALIYMNGTTDYIEAYAYMDATPEITGGASSNRFSAFLARSA